MLNLSYRKNVFEGEIPMSNKEKLIHYIRNLTNEEADLIIYYLKESASFAKVSPHPLPNNSPQER